MQFQPGQSGNPAGRPRGSRNKATVILQALLDGDVAEIGDRLVRRAKLGDLAAIRMCVDRILPRRREAPICFELPPIASAADLANAYEAIRAGLASGDLAPREALELGRFAERMAASVQISEAATLSAQPAVAPGQGAWPAAERRGALPEGRADETERRDGVAVRAAAQTSKESPPASNRNNTGKIAGTPAPGRTGAIAGPAEAGFPVNNRRNTGKIAGTKMGGREAMSRPAAEAGEAAPPASNRNNTGKIAGTAARGRKGAIAGPAEAGFPVNNRKNTGKIAGTKMGGREAMSRPAAEAGEAAPPVNNRDNT